MCAPRSSRWRRHRAISRCSAAAALPTISLTGSGSKITQDQVLGGNQTLDTVGVSFNWPLFQGGAIASAVRQSRALFREAQATL